MLKQIEDIFSPGMYFIDSETAEVYIKENNEFKKVKCNKRQYKLKTINGELKSINMKPLYYICFNKNFCNDNIKDLPGEEWKEIKKSNGMYYISNQGRVKSLKGYNAIILKPKKTNLNYDRVDLFLNGLQQTRTIHSLVAEYFLYKPNNENVVIHHKNLNSKDNRAENLQYLERLEHQKLHSKLKKERKN